MSGRQQTVEQVLSTPEGRENLARSITAPPSLIAIQPDLPELPPTTHDRREDDDFVDGLLIPLWAILLAAGVGTLTWGILMLLGR